MAWKVQSINTNTLSGTNVKRQTASFHSKLPSLSSNLDDDISLIWLKVSPFELDHSGMPNAYNKLLARERVLYGQPWARASIQSHLI